ncbi:MAG: alpha/beta hydrolase [Streptosporangiaceae bacterium]
MRARADCDRLAVSTYVEAGEEIPNGDPSVTDAERAAAGRETLAERFAAVLPGNRSRAAERHTADELPDGEDVARVWRPRDPAELRARLTEPPMAIWSSGDVLEVLWHGQADEVQLCGGVQPRLWPVAGTDDLWEVSLRIRHLDRAVISIVVASRQADGAWPRQIPDTRVWRGPRAPAAAPPRELRGNVSTHTLDSAAMRGERELTVYQPPGASRPLPGCVLADGESVRRFAPTLESAIEAGVVPPVLLVGLHNAPGAFTSGSDLRAQEYLPGHNRRRFDAHLRFVTSEVLPWADERFGPVAGPWVAAGFSNGAAWAIAAAQRRPDLIGAVAGFSAGVVPRRISGAARSAGVRHYLAAGTLEPGFRRSIRDWAERLDRAGLACRHEEWIGGHDQVWWAQQLPVALGWLLQARGA